MKALLPEQDWEMTKSINVIGVAAEDE